MPRPRKKNRNAPPGVYLNKGRWFLREAGKETKLAGGDAKLEQVWQAYLKLKQVDAPKQNSLEWLCDQYIASKRFESRAPSTQRDYKVCKKIICGTKLKSGQLFGDVMADTITPGAIRKYADKRSESAPVRANRELAFLGVVFSYGYERDLVPRNPVEGVKKNPTKPRDRYVTEGEYRAIYQRAPEWLRICMELSYLCRLRRGKIIGPDAKDAHGKVVGLQRAYVLKQGLRVVRSKGSKEQVITWTPHPKNVVQRALKLQSTISTTYLIHDRKGQKIKGSAFSSAWTRAMNKAVKEKGIQRFTFHDLKRRGVSDAVGDKLQASGHESPSMLAVYDVSIPEVSPTK